MFTQAELTAALQAINSLLSKCETAQPKLKPGTSQHALLTRRIKSLQIASALIQQALAAPIDSPK